MRQLSRFVFVLAVILASLPLLGRSLSTVAQGATPAPFLGRAFIGETSDPDTFVAVVVAEGDGAQRQARAYLCNGTTMDVWLLGTLSAEQLTIQAEDGALLEGTLSEAGVDGTATLTDGARLSFTAQPATGIAGLYDVVLNEDGRITGTATDGRHLAGVAVPGVAEEALLVAVVIEEPDGAVRPVAALATPDASGQLRWIVQADGTVVGKHKAGSGSGSVFTGTQTE